MATEDVKIKKSDSPISDEVATHPAFGQIEVVRTSSGGGNTLYGSDFNHQRSISLTIYRSELHRSLSGDRHHATEPLIRVEMSEAQWASIMSFVGLHGGMPVTLRRIGNESVPDLPRPGRRSLQFRKEMEETLSKAVEQLEDALKEIDSLPISAKRKLELRRKVDLGAAHLFTNAEFVADRFDEHMEETVAKAKQEVMGFEQRVLGAGVKTMAIESKTTVKRIARTKR